MTRRGEGRYPWSVPQDGSVDFNVHHQLCLSLTVTELCTVLHYTPQMAVVRPDTLLQNIQHFEITFWTLFELSLLRPRLGVKTITKTRISYLV